MKFFTTSFFSMFIFFCSAQNLGLKWAEVFDATNDLFLIDIESDSDDNIYICGHFNGPFDIDPSSGSFNLITHGLQDIFVAKFNSQGDFIWARSMGSYNDDSVEGMDVNSYGDIVLLFDTDADFDVLTETPGTEVQISDDAILVLWLNSEGAVYGIDGWLGFENYDYLNENILITDQFETYLINNNDDFLVKWNNQLVQEWQKETNALTDHSIEGDAFGNIYLTHEVSGTGYLFPQSLEGFYSVTGSSSNVMVTKLSSGGTVLWSGLIGGAGEENTVRIVSDKNQRIFIAYEAGSAVESSILGAGNLNPYYGSQDVVLSCYNLNGAEIWTKVIGGISGDELTNLSYSEGSDEIYAGIYTYPEFDGDPSNGTTPEAGPIFGYNATNGLISSWGKAFQYILFNGGTSVFHYAPLLRCLSDGTFIAGDRFYISVDVAPGYSTQIFSSNQNYNLFLAKYGQCDSQVTDINAIVCEGEAYIYNNTAYYEGSHVVYELNAEGCDNVVNLNITETAPEEINYTIYSCESEVVTYEGNVITETGDYNFEWYNNQGCLDSSVSVYAYFVNIPVLGVVSGGNNNYVYFLSSPSTATAQYSLVNCENNQVVQQGNYIYYTADQEGSYYLTYDLSISGQAVCSGQTECLNTDGTVNVEESLTVEEIKIFPNPAKANGEINVSSNGVNAENIKVFDVSGKLVFSLKAYQENTKIDISNLNSGVYFMEVETSEGLFKKLKFFVD